MDDTSFQALFEKISSDDTLCQSLLDALRPPIEDNGSSQNNDTASLKTVSIRLTHMK